VGGSVVEEPPSSRGGIDNTDSRGSLLPPWQDSAVSLRLLVPGVELVLLNEIGRRIGTLATLALIVATGALGACLARRQGLRVSSGECDRRQPLAGFLRRR
jgi:hypothetical protein